MTEGPGLNGELSQGQDGADHHPQGHDARDGGPTRAQVILEPNFSQKDSKQT